MLNFSLSLTDSIKPSLQFSFLYFGLVALEQGSTFTRFFRQANLIFSSCHVRLKQITNYKSVSCLIISFFRNLHHMWFYLQEEFHFRLKTSLGIQRYNVVDIRGSKNVSIEAVNRSIKELIIHQIIST